MTSIAACSSSSARVKDTRSFTPESIFRSEVAISHSLRSTFRIFRAFWLRRDFSSDRRNPQIALKYGIIRGATNIVLPRASFA